MNFAEKWTRCTRRRRRTTRRVETRLVAATRADPCSPFPGLISPWLPTPGLPSAIWVTVGHIFDFRQNLSKYCLIRNLGYDRHVLIFEEMGIYLFFFLQIPTEKNGFLKIHWVSSLMKLKDFLTFRMFRRKISKHFQYSPETFFKYFFAGSSSNWNTSSSASHGLSNVNTSTTGWNRAAGEKVWSF